MSINLTDYQIRATVLFAAGAAKAPIPKTAVFAIVSECGLNAFEAGDALEQLAKDGHIRIYQDGAAFVQLSDEGKKLAEIAKNDIPAALRQKITAVAAEEIAKLRADLDVECFIEPDGDGFLIRTGLRDGGQRLMSLQMYAPTKMQAQMMTENFKKDPLNAYRNVLAAFFTK